MKKTVMTLIAAAFGMGVAFAQTTPQTDNQQESGNTVIVEQVANRTVEEDRTLKFEELPAAIQESLKTDAYKALHIVTITEIQPKIAAPAATPQYQIAFTEQSSEPAAAPSLIVTFDVEGQELARQDPAETKTEVEE